MDIKEIVIIVGMLITLGISGLSLYKAFKVTKKEVLVVDADLSTKYSNLANLSLQRAQDAEKKLKEMEKQVALYEQEIKNLGKMLENHEAEIQALKAKIADQEWELSILRKKLISQDVDLVDLKQLLNVKK